MHSLVIFKKTCYAVYHVKYRWEAHNVICNFTGI